MSQVSGNPSGTGSILPAPPGASSDCLSESPLWKKLPDVLKTVIQTELLTPEEKSNLEQMIRKENIEVKAVVEQSANVDELIAKLADFVRSTRPLIHLPTVEKAPEAEFESAIKKISAHKNLKLAVKTLLKTLQGLQKKPTDVTSRKLRMDNIVFKKYISGVEGAQDFMEAVGYRLKEVAGKKYLEIEQEQLNGARLSRAIDLLTLKLKDIELPEKEKALVPERLRINCLGGCGYWGDEKKENMCSLCYKKKHDIKSSPPSETSSVPRLCSKGCGYFGMAKFKGMCSVCFSKDASTRRKETKRRLRITMTKIRAIHMFKLGLRPVQKNKSRCWKCPRKVGITGIECRCGYIFCGEHRYASEHDCPFDFKKAHQKKLTKDNVKVIGKKLEKIDSDE